jgi:hypothetical protein
MEFSAYICVMNFLYLYVHTMIGSLLPPSHMCNEFLRVSVQLHFTENSSYYLEFTDSAKLLMMHDPHPLLWKIITL